MRVVLPLPFSPTIASLSPILNFIFTWRRTHSSLRGYLAVQCHINPYFLVNKYMPIIIYSILGTKNQAFSSRFYCFFKENAQCDVK